MLGAPADIAKTLAADWRDQVLTFQATGVEAAFIGLLQDL
jgi:hypothetical protein